MPLFDKAKNALLAGADAQGKFIGQTAGEVDGFPLSIYEMIDESIRALDKSEGQLLLQRMLHGPQREWEETVARIRSLPTLRSVADCPADLLKFLRLTLGWTRDIRHLTDPLDTATLRRLLSESIALWRMRGSEEAYGTTIKLVFQAASRVWNWFDRRWVLDESVLSEQHQGRDPHLFSEPGSGDAEEFFSNLRIVDDGSGTIDRDLATAFVKLMRPVGERVLITWISFLELFDGDDGAWSVDGAGDLAVSGGAATLSDAAPESAYVTSSEAFATAGHVGYLRLRGRAGGAPGAFGGVLWRQQNGDSYLVRFDVVANTLKLQKTVGGVVTDLASYSFAADGEMLFLDTWYGLRWDAQPVGATSEIRVYINNVARISVTDATFTSGSIGFWHDGDIVDCDEVEIMPVPTDTTEIGINS